MDVIPILERLAEYGTAPDEGCSRFGVGYEDAFERLRQTYIYRAFEAGRSSQKFVIGPFGSGKTHFLRQLMEIARYEDCITAEVSLNKDVDFTQAIVVYQEVVARLRAKDQYASGVEELFHSCFRNVRSKAPSEAVADQVFDGWVKAIRTNAVDSNFAKVAEQAFGALSQNATDTFDLCMRWLSGEFCDRALAKALGVAAVTKGESNRIAHRYLLSVCQLVRHARFRGTIICFDEAEQGFGGVPKKKMDRILSMLMSGINQTADLQNGAVLMVFGITPDIADRMEDFAALQQRVADAGKGQGFFDGNTYAPRIDLTKRGDVVNELTSMGYRLADFLFDSGDALIVPRDVAYARIQVIAADVARNNPSSQNRRDMAKASAAYLLSIHPASAGFVPQPADPEV